MGIGNTEVQNTATKEKPFGGNLNNNQNNASNNNNQVERISITIPTNPLLLPNASVQI